MKQRENSGVLFKNDRKEKETHPDYNGKINIGGTEHWLSAWIKEGAKGKFMSLAIGKPVEESINQAKQAAGGQPSEPADGDIPFSPLSSKV